MKIIIKKEYLALVPRPAEEDYENIFRSIKDTGFDKSQPIVVNQNGYVLDGHTRFIICKKLEIEPTYIVKEFEDQLDEKLFIISTAKDRRHLSVGQKALLSLAFLDIHKEKATQRMVAGVNPTPTLAEGTKGETRIITGGEFGIGKTSVLKAEKIDKLDKRVANLVKSGKISLEEGYERVIEKEKSKSRKEILKTIEKQEGILHGNYLSKIQEVKDDSISCLITDITEGMPLALDQREDYSSEDEISKPLDKLLSALSLKMAKDSFVYIFIKPKQYTAIDIVAKHFKLKNVLVWDKGISSKVPNNYFYNHELVVFAAKGNPWLVKPEEDRNSILKFPRENDEEKPVNLLEYLVENSTIEGELVFDPIAKTGSTLVAAKKLKRKFLGIESTKKNYQKTLIKLSKVVV